MGGGERLPFKEMALTICLGGGGGGGGGETSEVDGVDDDHSGRLWEWGVGGGGVREGRDYL